MAYKFIFSQMFDVRPRKESGDLDLEKIRKIQAILNLRAEEIEEVIIHSGRIIDLKNKINGQEKPNKATKTKLAELVRPAFLLRAQEPIEIGVPRAEEILSIFEMIEEAEQFLKQEEVLKKKEIRYRIKPENFLSQEEIFLPPVRQLESFVPEEPVYFDEENSAPLIFQTAEETPEPFFEPQTKEPILLEVKEPSSYLPADFWQDAYVETSFPVPAQRWWQYFKDFWNSIKSKASGLGHFFGTPFAWPAKSRALMVFGIIAFLLFSFFPLLGWFSKVLSAKETAVGSGMTAYQSLLSAKDAFENSDFAGAEQNFAVAAKNFAAADSQINKTGGWLISALGILPGFSSISSQIRLVGMGEQMSEAGQDFAQMLNLLSQDSLNFSDSGGQFSISNALTSGRGFLEKGLEALVAAKQNLDQIDIDSLPNEVQPQLSSLKDKLPQLNQMAAQALDWTDKFSAILGSQSAKKYLLIFQNNAEARATGGFIGTYGLVDLDQGEIKNLFIDGIFNADGQLREKIMPPSPIQKISTAWSMHDANWFADFPTSAQKIMWFYEKTGGPTPDGVISLTPTVIERLLELTGPIEMPEYQVTLDDQNFIDIGKYKVEVDYDKNLNQPKKILADFAPKFIDKISEQLENNTLEVLKVINQALKEKHILLYFSDSELEDFVKTQGWAGRNFGIAAGLFFRC